MNPKHHHRSDADATAENSQLSTVPSFEPHYSVQALAERWGLDESTIRRMFEKVPGVLKLGNDRRRKGKRAYYILRIPASVAEREYRRRLIAPTTTNGR